MAEPKEQEFLDDIADLEAEQDADDMIDIDEAAAEFDEIDALRVERDEYKERFMRALADAENSRKRDIADFLELTQQGDGVRIFIGSENKLFSLSGSSLVVSPYMNADRKIIGAVGVIGPTRLNYGRIVPIVDYTAQLVGKMIADQS